MRRLPVHNPLRSGHVLVAPREEVDHWLDLDDDLTAHLTKVSRSIGRAVPNGFGPARVGLEVFHVHIHLVPIVALHDMDFDNAAQDPDPAELDRTADAIRRELTELGFEEVVSWRRSRWQSPL